METGDGLLARFSPAGGSLTPAALAGLADAALAFGNGVVEVTARGALQVRGLRPDTARAFDDALRRLGVDVAAGPAIVVNPLAGLDAAAVDPRPVAREIAARSSDLRLGPKVTAVVDGGGLLHLDAVPADVRLAWSPSPPGASWHVAPSGASWHLAVDGEASTPRWLGVLDGAGAAEGARRVLALVASRGRSARARDLPEQAVRDALCGLVAPAPPPGRRPAADAVGLHLLAGGAALGVAGPFGQIAADALLALAAAAVRHGAPGIRPAPGRVLLATGLDAAAATVLRDAARREGFVTDLSEPRRRVVACAGRPACGSGEIAARTLAAELASAAPGLLDDSVMVHVSGCAKGCARPSAAAITLVGAAERIGILLDAGPRDAPLGHLPPAALPGAFRRLDDALAPLRREGCGTAAALARIGPQATLALLLEDHR